MLERWRRKLIESGDMKPPAILIVPKGLPRGLSQSEIRDGLDESKADGAPVGTEPVFPEEA